MRDLDMPGGHPLVKRDPEITVRAADDETRTADADDLAVGCAVIADREQDQRGPSGGPIRDSRPRRDILFGAFDSRQERLADVVIRFEQRAGVLDGKI
jgi:hypothetical protein